MPCVFQDVSSLAGGDGTLSSSMWTLGIVLPPAFCGAVLIFTWRFTRPRAHQHSARLKETSLQIPGVSALCLCSFFLSGTNDRCPDPSALESLYLQLTWSPGLVWVRGPASWPGNGLWAVDEGSFRAHLVCFPCFQDYCSILLVVQGLTPAIPYNLFSFLVVYGERAVSVSGTSSWAKEVSSLQRVLQLGEQ